MKFSISTVVAITSILVMFSCTAPADTDIEATVEARLQQEIKTRQLVTAVPETSPATASLSQSQFLPDERPSAVCKDGAYSYSKTRRGTCSHHGGVDYWVGFANPPQTQVPAPLVASEDKQLNEDAESIDALVIRVIDGDTVEVKFNDGEQDTVRLLGVDTPETNTPNKPNEYGAITDLECLEAYGVMATRYAIEELDGKSVTLVLDEKAGLRGGYGRLLAYVEVDGADFNKSLVREGYARVYEEGESTRESEYLQQELIARKKLLKLWSCTHDIEPKPSPIVKQIPTPAPVPTATLIPTVQQPFIIKARFSADQIDMRISKDFHGCSVVLPNHPNRALMYKTDRSWTGILYAGWCGQGLNPIMQRAVNPGIAVEIDVKSLPGDDIGRCIFNVNYDGSGNAYISNVVSDATTESAWVELKVESTAEVVQLKTYNFNGICN
ncbi:thermonuclease family protein [Dehalococcoidia bacterium]|nr:thermonuclease family protein [Dehalococcoidia bacterium]